MNVKTIADLVEFRPDKMEKVNLFESPRMFCDLYCLEPGQQQAVHSHADNDKIYCLLEGQGRFTVGSDTRVLEAGQIVCAPAGKPHGVANTSRGRLTCLVFMAPHPEPQRFA